MTLRELRREVGNDAVEATYPYTRVDERGQTLDGSKHAYTLTFAAGETSKTIGVTVPPSLLAR